MSHANLSEVAWVVLVEVGSVMVLGRSARLNAQALPRETHLTTSLDAKVSLPVNSERAADDRPCHDLRGAFDAFRCGRALRRHDRG